METLQLSIRLAHCAMKKMQRGRRIRESLSLCETPAAIGNANPPSTFQLESSKFTCN
uniref:GM14547p n=1 Tax=Drosophila melanogaster TaxID=7227 RepID=Q8T943_DROME